MKKIMFNDKFGLTQAVLDGRKTQTRRLVSQHAISKYSELEDPTIIDDAQYDVGDIVAVAMSYKSIYERVKSWEYAEEYRERHEASAGWNNKMFTDTKMPFAKVRITNVSVQNLQDITDAECLLEGVYIFGEDDMDPLAYFYTYHGAKQLFCTPRDAYARLIDAISGKGTWESNPYVYTYDFELVR